VGDGLLVLPLRERVHWAELRATALEPLHSRLKRLTLLAGERLSRVPAGYSADDDRVELLKHKALHAARTWEPDEWLHTRQALEKVRSAWREMATMNTWLADNVGATAKEPRRR